LALHGGFNSVLDQYEKIGGRPIASSSNCPFRKFIDHFGMIDVGFVGILLLGVTTEKVWKTSKKGWIEVWLLLLVSIFILISL
jgi:hypothetical protein